MQEPSLFIDENEVYCRYRVNPFISLAWAENPELMFDDPENAASQRAKELVIEIQNYLLFNTQLLSQLLDIFQYIMLNTSILAISKNIAKFGTEVLNVCLNFWTSIPRIVYEKYNFLAGTGSELIFFLYAQMKQVYVAVDSRILARSSDVKPRFDKIILFDSLHRLRVAFSDYSAGMPTNRNLQVQRSLFNLNWQEVSFSLPKLQKEISLFALAFRSTYIQNISENPRKVSLFLLLTSWLYWKYRDQNDLWFFDIQPYLIRLPARVQEFAQDFRARTSFLQDLEL
jgi:hypothetical protein